MHYKTPKNLYTLVMCIFMGIKTSLTKASGKGNSLRTTVPKHIVEQFNLKEGDEMDWMLKVRNNKLIIEVEPKRRE